MTTVTGTIPLKPYKAFPALPIVGGDLASHSTFLREAREAIEQHERRRGDPLDSFVRVRELIDLGLIGQLGNVIVNSSETTFGGSVETEFVHDTVGAMLTDTSSIDFTHDDAADTISAVVLPAGVNHNLLQNYVVNEHINHTSVTLTAGTGLTGGGDISANRTFALNAASIASLALADTAVQPADLALVAYTGLATDLVDAANVAFLDRDPQTFTGENRFRELRIEDTGATDYVLFTHDGTNLEAVVTNTNAVNWRGSDHYDFYGVGGAHVYVGTNQNAAVLDKAAGLYAYHPGSEAYVELWSYGTGPDYNGFYYSSALGPFSFDGDHGAYMWFSLTAAAGDRLTTFPAPVEITASRGLRISHATPLMDWEETDAAADETLWRARVSSGLWILATYTDAEVEGIRAIQIDRGTGTAVSEIEMNATLFDMNGSMNLSGTLILESTSPQFRFTETDAAANETVYDISSSAGDLLYRTRTDALGVGVTYLSVQRTGTTVDELEFNATALDINANIDVSGTSLIAGIATFSSALRAADGTAAAASYSFTNDVGLGLYRSADDVLGIATGGAARAILGVDSYHYFTADGDELYLGYQPATLNYAVRMERLDNVHSLFAFQDGCGTIFGNTSSVGGPTGSVNDLDMESPVWVISPGAAGYTVTGFVPLGNGHTFRIVVPITAAGNLTLAHQNAGSAAANRLSLPGSANLVLLPGQSVTLYYETPFNDRWVVTDVSPDAVLSTNVALLNRTAQEFSTEQRFVLSTGNSNPAISIRNANPTLHWYETDGSTDNKIWYANVRSEALQFGVINDANSLNAVWLEVNRTGAVIDTLTFTGATTFVNTVTMATNSLVEGGASNANLYLQNNSDASSGFLIQHDTTGATYLWNYENDPILFATNNALRLTIDAVGVVLGTRAFKTTGAHAGTSSNGHAFFDWSGGTTARFGGYNDNSPAAQPMQLFCSTLQCIAFGSGTLVSDASGNITISSDARLKESVVPYKAGLNEVLALEPVSYMWTRASGFDRKQRYVGFLAQEVEAALPDAVGRMPRKKLPPTQADLDNPAVDRLTAGRDDPNDDPMRTLSDRVLLAALVNAVKELAGRVARLESGV